MSSKCFLEKLQALPHRGTGSDFEKNANDLIEGEYEKLGFKPHKHEFRIAKNGSLIHVCFHLAYVIVATSF